MGKVRPPTATAGTLDRFPHPPPRYEPERGDLAASHGSGGACRLLWRHDGDWFESQPAMVLPVIYSRQGEEGEEYPASTPSEEGGR